jgi:hypothetical protein
MTVPIDKASGETSIQKAVSFQAIPLFFGDLQKKCEKNEKSLEIFLHILYTIK